MKTRFEFTSMWIFFVCNAIYKIQHTLRALVSCVNLFCSSLSTFNHHQNALTSTLAIISKSYIFWEHGFPYNTMTYCIFSKETEIQDMKKISFVGKKRAREKSDQKAGETCALWMSMDLYNKCIISKNIIGHHLTVLQLTAVFQFYPVHPSTPMRDQDRISPHNISEKWIGIKRKIN